MPFIRYARDKRGYESTVVLHAYRAGQGPPRTRVLYFFRSPSHVKVGRKPLDPEVMEALEHTHPDLTFDWPALVREPAETQRADAREHHHHRHERAGARQAPPARPAPAPAPVVEVDESLLGKLVGAREAARIRGRFADVTQRVLRRSRSPEERDRLMERVQRLNPDDWADEMGIRAAVSTFDAEVDAIASELPQRRRGRRGGRTRPDGPGPTGSPEDDSPVRSAIIEDEGHDDDAQLTDPPAPDAAESVFASDAGNGGRFSTDAGDPSPGTPTNDGPATAGAGSDPGRTPDLLNGD